MRKLLALFLCLALLVMGGTTVAEDVTITKSAQGFGGEVSVTLQFAGDDIVSAEIVGELETESIGQAAIPTLAEQVVAADSAEIEGVTGATFTSQAVKDAVAAAILEKNGGTAAGISFTPGTYEGEAYGNTSTIGVAVTLSENAIEAIEITKQNETPILYDAARDTVIAEILENQSLAVDAVSGASTSSNAIIQAVRKAIESSGADVSALLVPVEKEVHVPEDIALETDVVVIGGGGAGLVAALTCAQNGANVIVLEKAPFVGGNLSVFGGIYNTPDAELQSKVEMTDAITASIEAMISAEPKSEEHAAAMAAVKADYEKWKADGAVGLFDSPALFSLQTWNSGDQVADKHLVDVMAENAYEGYQWLKSIGVEFEDKVTQGAGSLYQRTHGAIKPNGSGFITAYEESLKNYPNATIYTNTAGKHLIMEDGVIVGVQAEATNGDTYTIKAKNVILATGGFAGNVELRVEYCQGDKWEDLGPNVMTTNLKSVTGDGIIMAKEVGANLVDMEQIQLLHLGNLKTGSTKGVIPYKGRNSNEVIFVNSEGNRFVAEDGRRDVMCNAVLQQPGAFYWMVHDSSNIDPYSVTAEEYIKGGYLFRADTLEELAALINVDPATLVATVNAYNEAVDKGVDELTGRTLLVAKIEQAPFFAGARVPSAHHTMGGVQIDDQAHVLNEKGEIIPGLLAAGEVCGDIHGGNRVGGNAVVDTVVYGRIAGNTATTK